jgi:hypothetical protein
MAGHPEVVLAISVAVIIASSAILGAALIPYDEETAVELVALDDAPPPPPCVAPEKAPEEACPSPPISEVKIAEVKISEAKIAKEAREARPRRARIKRARTARAASPSDVFLRADDL